MEHLNDDSTPDDIEQDYEDMYFSEFYDKHILPLMGIEDATGEDEYVNDSEIIDLTDEIQDIIEDDQEKRGQKRKRDWTDDYDFLNDVKKENSLTKK